LKNRLDTSKKYGYLKQVLHRIIPNSLSHPPEKTSVVPVEHLKSSVIGRFSVFNNILCCIYKKKEEVKVSKNVYI